MPIARDAHRLCHGRRRVRALEAAGCARPRRARERKERRPPRLGQLGAFAKEPSQGSPLDFGWKQQSANLNLRFRLEGVANPYILEIHLQKLYVRSAQAVRLTTGSWQPEPPGTAVCPSPGTNSRYPCRHARSRRSRGPTPCASTSPPAAFCSRLSCSRP